MINPTLNVFCDYLSIFPCWKQLLLLLAVHLLSHDALGSEFVDQSEAVFLTCWPIRDSFWLNRLWFLNGLFQHEVDHGQQVKLFPTTIQISRPGICENKLLSESSVTKLYCYVSLRIFKWVYRNPEAFLVGIWRILAYHEDYTTGLMDL